MSKKYSDSLIKCMLLSLALIDQLQFIYNLHVLYFTDFILTTLQEPNAYYKDAWLVNSATVEFS